MYDSAPSVFQAPEIPNPLARADALEGLMQKRDREPCGCTAGRLYGE